MRVRVAAAILIASLGSESGFAQTKSKIRSRGAVPARKTSPAKPKTAPTPTADSDLAPQTEVPPPASKDADTSALPGGPATEANTTEPTTDRPTASSVTPTFGSRASELTNEVLERMKPQRGSEHRYLFVAGGISGFVGVGLSYWAQGEARRANSLENAVDARRAYDGARASAAGANILFAVALACVSYGILLEVWPRESTAQPTHTLHF